jgi:pimeloyl-ACP methyl ester carboxylesterase
VFVDAAQVAFWTDGQLASFLTEYAPVKEKVYKEAPGRYWMYVEMPRTTQLMRQIRFPPAVPAVALMAGRPPFATADENTRWQQAQRHFVAQAPNRKLVLVPESGHYIMLDAPPVVIHTIAQFYEQVLKPSAPLK